MSTPPRPRPPSKRMRLDTTRVDSRKSRSTCALAPQAKRFRFSDSSSSSSSNYPLPLYGSSPDRMSFEVLAPGMVGNSQLSTCSVALQRLRPSSERIFNRFAIGSNIAIILSRITIASITSSIIALPMCIGDS